MFTVASDKIMIYGNPKVDYFTVFSDQAATLIVYQNEKCTKRTYQTVERKTTPEGSDLNEEECKDIINKVNYIVDHESKYLDLLSKMNDDKKPQKSNGNAFHTSYKSGSDARSLDSQTVNPSDTKQGGTSNRGVSNENPLGLYGQFRGASQSDKVNPAGVSHQQVGSSGVTVTEQVSSSRSSDPVPVAVSHQQIGSSGVTVTEQASSTTGNDREPVAQPVADQTSSSSHSFFDRLSSKYNQVKTQVVNHMHHPSATSQS